MDWGIQEAGIEIQQSLEYEPNCIETLKLNYGHKVISSDMRDQTVLDQVYADILIGTYPCNKYSTIGDIHGTRTGDELFLHFFRHIVLAEPEAFIVENVPGMKKFKVAMEAIVEIPQYFTYVFCPLNAMEFGLPQKRARLIIFGTRKDFNFRPPTGYKRIPFSSIIEENPEVTQTKGLIDRMKGKYRDKPIITDPSDPNAVAPTAVAHYHKDRGTRVVADPKFPMGVRPYSVREYARLQGVPDSFKFAGSTNEQYKQIGNGVAVPMAQWCGTELVRYFN